MRVCIVEGCNEKHLVHGFCKRHANQFKRYGETRTRNNRDPNEFIIEGDICRIILYDKYSNPKGEAIIDAEDYEKCKPYKWCQYTDSYGNERVMNNEVGHLNTFLMGFKPSRMMCVDHIDGNTLNNRRSNNLQICTMQQNQLKKKMQNNNTSGLRGVTWYVNPGKTSRWMAQIYFNHHRFHLGYFDTKEEAGLAYNKKAKELFGKFAKPNLIKRR